MDDIERLRGELTTARSDMAEARRQTSRLTGALEWYADEDNYLCRPYAEGLGGLSNTDVDCGERARAVLADQPGNRRAGDVG